MLIHIKLKLVSRFVVVHSISSNIVPCVLVTKARSATILFYWVKQRVQNTMVEPVFSTGSSAG